MIVQGPLDVTVLSQAISEPFTILGDPNGAEVEIIGPSETVIEAAATTARSNFVNQQTLRDQTIADIDSLRASIDALNVIIAKTNAEIGPKDTKDVARELKSVARSTVRIARTVVGAFDSTDAGAS